MPIGEKFIISDDTSVTQKDFYEIIRINCKVSNEKAKKILGWYPKYPSYKRGLKETIKEIENG